MKLFQHRSDIPRLGPLLREARESRRFSMEQAAQETRLPLEVIQGLEEDNPNDIRRTRIQAVTYARFLGLDLPAIRDSLPSLPDLAAKHQPFLSKAFKGPQGHLEQKPHSSPLQMLAPMGKFSLVMIVVATLLGTWGLVHQISRVRFIPGLSSNISVSN